MTDDDTRRNSEDIRRNAENIRSVTADVNSLAVTVTRVVTMVENSEERRWEDMQYMRDAAASLGKLGERIGSLSGIERDIGDIKDTMGEHMGDIRAVRHDLNNAKQAIQGIALLGEKVAAAALQITAQGVKIESLEKWRSGLDGAGGVLKGFGRAVWAVFGGGLTALGFFVLREFFLAGR